jgi:hypothetical protein
MKTTGTLNCGKYRISINDDGVSVWDGKNQQWIIDASTIAKDHIFQLSMSPGNSIREIDNCKSTNRMFATRHYKRKTKSRRTTSAKSKG